MNNLATVLIASFIGFSAFSQVGVNTTEPTSTLDVNGSLRVRGDKNLGNVAKRLIGVDDDGNFMEVVVDKNLVLENNQIRGVDQFNEIGDIPILGIPIIDDIDLVILPGEPNRNKTVIRLRSLLGNMTFTGIKAGTDGQMVYLYPTTGDLTLIPNSLLSIFGNRIETNANTTIPQYSMIRLMYDASVSKWIIMEN